MFNGIVEDMAQVRHLAHEEGNLHITLACSFAAELQIDQSIAHNGACLTVVSLEEDGCTVTTVQETLDRGNLGLLQMGDCVNVGRSMMLGGRPDSRIIQGRVDQTARYTAIREMDGSHYFTFAYEVDREMVRQDYMTIEKGSAVVDDVSPTVYNLQENSFEVTIIPYTLEHTNFKYFKEGSVVNLEFDILGKYITRLCSFD